MANYTSYRMAALRCTLLYGKLDAVGNLVYLVLNQNGLQTGAALQCVLPASAFPESFPVNQPLRLRITQNRNQAIRCLCNTA